VKVEMMPRGEYLKYYAKDEEENYIGSEEPAEDYSLKESDQWRRGLVSENEALSGKNETNERSERLMKRAGIKLYDRYRFDRIELGYGE
jgi:hypothetical protein